MNFDEFYEKFELYEKMVANFKGQIRREKANSHILTIKMNELYRYLKQIAPTFYNTDESIDYSGFYHTLINEVKYIESLLPGNYFIIESEPNFIYQNNESKIPLNNPYDILDWLVYMARSKYAYTSFWTKETSIEGLSFEDECTNMCKIIDDICKENNISCTVKRINPGFEDTARLYRGTKFHDICIINLKGNYYLVDCTYRQFFMLKGNSLDRIGIPYLANAKPGIFMTLEEHRLNLAQSLLLRGWISLSKENIKNYFDGFALSFRNGHYYEETNDYSYTTNYSSNDYINFLDGSDNQVNHEGKRVLSLQMKI